MNLQDMLKRRAECIAGADAAVTASESANRVMTDAENQQFTSLMAEVNALDPQIKQREQLNTLKLQNPSGRIIPGAARNADAEDRPAWQTRDYRRAVAAFLASRGEVRSETLRLGADELGGFKFPALSAANYEGGATSGVPIVPSIVEQTIVPLAPPIIGIESIATVIPTSTDLKFPRKKAHGAGAAKVEGDGTGTNLFTGTSPQTEQFTLTAHMIGHPEDASWELLQDVAVFQSFLTQDILLSLATLKDAWFATGNGTTQAQGLKGNVGTGVTGVAAGTDVYGSELIDATYDVMALLNPAYDNANTRWLMRKTTGLLIRKSQRKANLFDPIWVRQNGVDFLHGNEVVYSSSMDTVATTNTPVMYGDFKAGYLIGYRGGAGVNVKILDQPKALEGLLTILGYQRVDGKVRRSEAIQGITLA